MLAPSGDGPFIGRAHELDRLRGGLDETAAGRPAIVVVGGESGVGKTRLVTEFLNGARDGGATVLIGGCTDYGESGPSYWAVLDALRPVWKQGGESGPAPVTPDGPTSTVSPPVAADPSVLGPVALFESILEVLRRLAEEAPVVLAVEDVHWADRSTRDLLAFLLANLQADRVMTIVTYRSEAMDRRHSMQALLGELRRSRRAEFIELRPFTRDEIVAKLQGILGRPPDAELVELTWSRSDGNAFFAEELVAAVLEGHGKDLPETLRHILLCRVDVLSESARQVVRLVAVGSDAVSYPLLSTVADMDEGDLVSALRECVERQLLAVRQDGGTYRFRHSLMQEVLYEELLPGEKQLLHAAYGRALEGHDGRSASIVASQLAYHWYAAGDARRALSSAVDAAVAALSIYGYAEAQRHFERAIELWDQVEQPDELLGLPRSELFERGAETAHLAGEHRRAADLIRAAVTPARAQAGGASGGVERGSRGIRCAELNQRLGRYLLAAGDSRGALKAYEEAVRCIPAGVVSAVRARVEGAYAEALMLCGRYRLSRERAEAALEVARAAGAQLEETQILATLGFDLAFLGESAEGVMALERAQVIAEELGNPDDIGRAYLNRAKLLSGPLNYLAEAAEIAERGVVRVGQLGLERTYGVALQAIAVNILFRLGRWQEADDYLHEALGNKPTGTAAIDLCLARAKLSVGRGDFAAAEADLVAVETLAPGGLGPQYEAPLLTLRAGLDLWLDAPEHAREAINRGIIACVSGSDDVWLLAPLIWHGLRAEADLAARARVRGDRAGLDAATTIAAGLLAQVQNLARDSHDVAPSIRQSISAYLGMCEGEAARTEERCEPDVWAEASRRFGELQQPYPSAYASWREAEALLGLSSRSSRATEALRRAHQIGVALGAVPFDQEVVSLAARARISLSDDSPADAGGVEPRPEATREAARMATKERFSLSDRELEVWLLLTEGVTNNQLGERLFIAGKTVSVHVTHILRKLGVKTRVQAITLAYQLGLVEPQPPQ